MAVVHLTSYPASQQDPLLREDWVIDALEGDLFNLYMPEFPHRLAADDMYQATFAFMPLSDWCWCRSNWKEVPC